MQNLNWMHKKAINFESLLTRHQHCEKNLWSCIESLKKASRRRSQSALAIHAAQKKYGRFYEYLCSTAQIVLEDALFCYRNSLAEVQFSCLGDARNQYGSLKDGDIVRKALEIIAGATPTGQRPIRFKTMGYTNWDIHLGSIALSARSYKANFIRPLDAVIKARERLFPSTQTAEADQQL